MLTFYILRILYKSKLYNELNVSGVTVVDVPIVPISIFKNLYGVKKTMGDFF